MMTLSPLHPDSGDRIALFFDAENAEASAVQKVIDELSLRGRITVRRAYGDFLGETLRPWREASARFDLTLCHTPPGPSGKNSADIALVIGAMDLIHSTTAEAIALVTTDSDFTPLATRAREAGMLVYAFGRAHASERFRLSVTRFTDVDILGQSQGGYMPTNQAEPLENAISFLRETIRSVTQGASASVPLELIERLLLRRYSDFDCRRFGARNLRELVERIPGTTIEIAEGIDRVRYRKDRRRSRPSSIPAS
jgi:hypothetical protein